MQGGLLKLYCDSQGSVHLGDVKMLKLQQKTNAVSY